MTPLEKLRKARERNVPVDGHIFTIRRPTNAEVASLSGTGLDMVKRFVVGWDLREIDVVPGGTDIPLPFDAELFADWIEDRPEFWAALFESIQGAYLEHAQAQDAARKN